MKKRISLKKILIITLIAVLVICVGLTAFLLFKDKLFNSDLPQICEEELVELSNENYVSFSEGFTDVKVTDEKSALEAVAPVSEAIGINDAEKELKVTSTNSFDGEMFYRVQQYYNDIPVYGRELLVVADKNGKAVALTSNITNISIGKVEFPDFNKDKFSDKIKSYLNFDANVENVTILDDEVNKVIYTIGTGNDYCAYEVIVSFTINDEFLLYRIISDAETGEILYANSILSDLGKSVNVKSEDGSVTTKGWLENNTYSLYNDECKISIFNFNGNISPKDGIESNFYKYKNIGVNLVESKTNKFDIVPIEAMYNTTKCYDYFNSLGDTGFNSIHVAFNDNYSNGNNARGGCENRTNEAVILFGTNMGTSDADVLAHEYTHSVSGKLVNWSGDTTQNGAINEGLSDIFGELAECSMLNLKEPDWKMISDNKKVGVYRNIENPSESGGLSKVPKTENPNGDKYVYSTVISHAAYLMNNGIDGDEKMKIDTELLAKIWYKSLFLLHSNATFNQCADAVYNATLITEGVTFDQRVCIRKAFGEVGLDVEAITSYNVLNGTTVYAISKDNKKYQNYHVKIVDSESGDTVDEADISDDKGYKLDLDNGKYILSLTDNDEKGSKSTFYKTIYLREIPNKKVRSYINILTDFYFDYDAPLKEKLSDLIDKYGIASDETYTTNLDLIGSSSWTNREGLVSAKLSDLDCDGINELVVVRLIGGELKSDAENIEIQVYYYTNDGVKSAGSLKFFTGDDLKEKQIDSFIYKIGNKKYIFVESDFTKYATEGTANVSYYVLEYTAGKLSKKKYLYLKTKFDAYISSKWTEVTWNGDVKKEKEIYYYDYEKNIKRGTYKDSNNPIKDYFVDFGLTETNDCFDLPRITRFFNIKRSQKLFEIIQNREHKNYSQCNSSLKDYTGLDHSKATTTAEKVPEWKEQYINFLEKEKIYTNASFGFSIVDIDENGIPELITTGFAAAGTQMIWIKDGEVVNQPIGYGELKYIPSDNLIYCSYLNYGIYNDYVYSFDNQDLNDVFTGTILPEENGFKKHGWFIGDLDNSVSESEYKQALNKAFDFDSAKGLDSCPSGSGEQIIQMIKAY